MKNLDNKPIVMVGMMGVGKTTLGKMLAENMACPFYDVDHEVVSSEGRSIPDIFKSEGEAAFRQIEERVFTRLVRNGFCVISTGGGAVTTASVAKTIKDEALSIWVHSAPEVILSRVSSDGSRPLLQNNDPLATLKKLEETRLSLYNKADIHVESGDEPIEVTFKKIIEGLNAYGL